MQVLDGVEFDDDSYSLIVELLRRLKATGAGDPYGLPKMNQLRIAHTKLEKTRASGVFAAITPTVEGAALIRSKKHRLDEPRAVLITKDNLEAIVRAIESRRSLTKTSQKTSEKSDPNQPGTVQGGQFESKRSKH